MSSDSDEEFSDNTFGLNDWPVNEDWLLKVLKEHHQNIEESTSITIIDFNVGPGCETGESVLSDILAVTVTYCLRGGSDVANHNLNFIVKLLPQDPFSRFFVTEAQFDLREIKFYTEIVPDIKEFITDMYPGGTQDDDLSLPIPKCYFANYSHEDHNPHALLPLSVLVLQNIKPHGFQSVEFSTGLNLRQAKAAIESIAKIHSLSLCMKITQEEVLPDRYPFLFQTSKASDSYQQLVERGLPQLFEFLESKNELKDILNKLNELRPHTKEIIENLLNPKEPIALITHTDFWCNNLMFKDDEDECKCIILDWQMVTYSRPTNDLALLLVSSIPADLRREHGEELLNIYWEKLNNICTKLQIDIVESFGYDRIKLGEEFKKAQLLALLLCIGSVDLALGNEQMEGRLVELLKDLHNENLLNVKIILEDNN